MTPTILYKEHIQSPIVWWLIIADDLGLRALDYSAEEPDYQADKSHITTATKSQLAAYYDGELTSFSLNFSLDDYTPFQRSVWNALVKIPYGKTTSYSELSTGLGDPLSVRAVGTANGRNPIPIIIPCHRVIGKNGSLTGYAHGLPIKRWLLEHEGAIARTPTLF